MINIKLINACNYHYTELLQKVILKHNALIWLPVCLKAAGAISGSLVFCKYVVEILKIETAFFTNKWIQV